MSFAAITRAHLDMAGGPRQLVLAGGAYLALIAAFSALAYRATDPRDHVEVHTTCLTIVAIVQGVFVILGFTDAIRRAIQRDRTNGMLESHRLTPLSGTQLALGYLTGPPLVAASLFVCGVVAGSYFAAWYGQSLGFPEIVISGWWMSQGALLLLGLLVNTFVLLLSAVAGRIPLLTLLILVALLGGWLLVMVIPGIGLLTGVLGGAWLFELVRGRGTGAGDPGAVVASMGLQLAFAVVFLLAAGHKLRFPHRPTFTLRMGLVLAGLTGVTIALGHHYMQQSPLADDNLAPWRWLGSAIGFLLVLQLPLITATQERASGIHSGFFEPTPPPIAPATRDFVPWALAALAGFVLVAALQIESSVVAIDELATYDADGIVRITVCIAIALWTDYAALLWLALLRWHPLWAFALSWGVLKLLPVLAQFGVAAVAMITDRPAEFDWQIATLSPLGTLAALFRSAEGTSIGLAFQAIVALGLTVVVLLTWSMRRSRAAALTQEPAT